MISKLRLLPCCLMLFFLTCISACQSRHSQGDYEEQQTSKVDTFLSQHFDSIYAFPANVQGQFEQYKAGLTDSADICQMNLFIGFCTVLQTGSTDSMLLVNDQGLSYCQRHSGNAKLEAICWNHRSLLAQQLGLSRDTSVACLLHAYDAICQGSQRSELVSICTNLADNYRLMGNLVKSAHYYHRALFLSDSLKNDASKFAIYVGLGQVYADLENYSMSDLFFGKAKEIPISPHSYERYQYLMSYGNSLYFRKMYAEAIPVFRDAYTVARSFKVREYEAPVEANLGELFTLTECFDSAHHYLDKASPYLLNSGIPDFAFYGNSLLADLALREGKLDEAHRYLLKNSNDEGIAVNYVYLHNRRLLYYYVRKGDYRKAFDYQQKVDFYDDSLRNVRASSNISEISQRFAQDTTVMSKNLQIAQKESELNRQYNHIILLIAVFSILLLMVIVGIVYSRKRSIEKYNRQVARIADLRMQNVRNRMSPHFVFNVLNSVKPAFVNHGDLWQPLQALIDLLRGNLLASDSIATPLMSEIDLVRHYVLLRAQNNPNTPRVVWNIDPNTDLTTMVPTMALQIPIENALKYAFDGVDERNQVSIDIHTDKDYLHVVIEDNGVGYSPTMQENRRSSNGTGTGLKVLYQTIELLNNKNVKKMHFNIDYKNPGNSQNQGTTVRIDIPNVYNFNL